MKQADMFRSVRSLPFAVVFFLWFALWLVAGRYISVGFYGFAIGGTAELALALTTLLVALALVIVRVLRPHRPSGRWNYAVLCIGFLSLAEVLWRLVMYHVPWDLLKGLAIVLDVATPALVAIGLAALALEVRVPRSAAPTPNEDVATI